MSEHFCVNTARVFILKMTDTLPVGRGDDIVVTEGNVNATFTVMLSPTSGKVAMVNYATANGTATAGSD